MNSSALNRQRQDLHNSGEGSRKVGKSVLVQFCKYGFLTNFFEKLIRPM